MKIPKVTDRRVRRTRDALRDALLKLILERGWDAVDVRDICERADVGRSTFYTHFADKEDLLLSGFDDLRKALKALRPAVAGSGKPLAFTRGLFDHAHANRWLFRALVGKRSGLAVQKRFRQKLARSDRRGARGIDLRGPVVRRGGALHRWRLLGILDVLDRRAQPHGARGVG